MGWAVTNLLSRFNVLNDVMIIQNMRSCLAKYGFGLNIKWS